MLVDTHCHLNFRDFHKDRNLVIERAIQAGLSRMLNPGIDLKSSREAIKLADAYPEIYAAVGVHPSDALLWEDSTFDELRELAQHPKVVAIGEIGLDYYRDKAPRDLQRRVFKQQLELAAELSLPVIVHMRNQSAADRSATLDLLGILVEWTVGLIAANSVLVDWPGVLHAYSGNLEEARQALDLNFNIGIAGPVTFPKAETLREIVANLPEQCLLIETDAPFLTPHPHRSERNEPAHVRFVAQEIAQLRKVNFDEVADTTTQSARQIFHW